MVSMMVLSTPSRPPYWCRSQSVPFSTCGGALRLARLFHDDNFALPGNGRFDFGFFFGCW